MNDSIKAKRAQILLGDIPLEVFQMPDGSYRLSQSQAEKAIDVPERSFRNFLSSKAVEALPYKNFRPGKIAINGNNTKITPIPIDLAVGFWIAKAKGGNTKALDLVMACAIESIERRADAAFGVLIAEEERQRRMALRSQGKSIRRLLTDSIKDYINRHPEMSENKRKWIYVNASDLINLAVFGHKSKKLAEILGCNSERIRDVIDWQLSLNLQELESAAIRRIDEHDQYPLTAIKEAAEALLIKPSAIFLEQSSESEEQK